MKNILKKVAITSVITLGLLVGGASANAAQETYTVKEGDTLSKISHDFVGDNSLIHTIAGLNGVQNIDLIFVGQELIIDTESKEIFVGSAPVVEVVEPSYVEQPAQEYVAPATDYSTYVGSSSSAKEWIAEKESNGSYTASNGYHYGRYQLDPNYLNGDFSPENQERVADQYVADRYGSWENAQSFWMANGWY